MLLMNKINEMKKADLKENVNEEMNEKLMMETVNIIIH